MGRMINVEIFSHEIIKPSEPTPDHLIRNMKLSFLDQISPSTYVPLVLFYDQTDRAEVVERPLLLKKSLAKALTQFFPLAGTLAENFSLECNDGGAEYFEARVSCNMAEVMENPDTDVLDQLLPYDPKQEGLCLSDSKRQFVLAIKYSVFTCGGVAIGVCVAHKVADGTSTVAFVNAWAATSRYELIIIAPSFEAVTHFPPLQMSVPPTPVIKEKIVSKRFIFSKSTIEALREKVSSDIDSQVKDPTRIEAVSSFLWKRVMEVTKRKPQLQVKHFVSHVAVNLRERMVPPLPPNSFGNIWQAGFATLPAGVDDYHALVSQMRTAIKEINSDYAKQLQNPRDEFFSSKKSRRQLSAAAGVVTFSFSSWCRFPVYEIDFGWGKPSWACSHSRPFKNLVILMRNKTGDGIEAWMNMLEQDMAIFERDEELLSYVSSQDNMGKW
ncbi:Transferase [Corchorus capsularis]|uniref:Transferase n=1 Tax=Corchorus capsularis TaxID=210143 RepID=A0A1R3IXE1_COCAP|nr:Transferase [Corchorus capsularis]